MKNYKMSEHLKGDRCERYDYIKEHSGFGNPVFKFYNAEHDSICVITDTGVMMGMNVAETVLATVFYLKLNQAERLARENGRTLSKELIKTIIKNQESGLIAGQPR